MLHSCFPERLKSLRQEKNMLQQDLAEHLKVSKSTISGWEVGRNQPNYDTLIELSIFFGVSVDYLIGRRNSSNQKHSTSAILLLTFLEQVVPDAVIRQIARSLFECVIN